MGVGAGGDRHLGALGAAEAIDASFTELLPRREHGVVPRPRGSEALVVRHRVIGRDEMDLLARHLAQRRVRDVVGVVARVHPRGDGRLRGLRREDVRGDLLAAFVRGVDDGAELPDGHRTARPVVDDGLDEVGPLVDGLANGRPRVVGAANLDVLLLDERQVDRGEVRELPSQQGERARRHEHRRSGDPSVPNRALQRDVSASTGVAEIANRGEPRAQHLQREGRAAERAIGVAHRDGLRHHGSLVRHLEVQQVRVGVDEPGQERRVAEVAGVGGRRARDGGNLVTVDGHPRGCDDDARRRGERAGCADHEPLLRRRSRVDGPARRRTPGRRVLGGGGHRLMARDHDQQEREVDAESHRIRLPRPRRRSSGEPLRAALEGHRRAGSSGCRSRIEHASMTGSNVPGCRCAKRVMRAPDDVA